MSDLSLSAEIRRHLATIRRCWRLTEEPIRSAGAARSVPRSQPPSPAAVLSLRVAVLRDLAYWVHVVVDEFPESLGPGDTIDCANVPGMCRFLASEADRFEDWRTESLGHHGEQLLVEVARHARAVRAVAYPRQPLMRIGDCPNALGDEVVCGTSIRVNPASPGSVKCRGCGTVDTIDGWILRMVGHEGPVTIPQLVPILHKRMGVVVTERTLRRWYRSGRLPARVGGSESTPLLDRRQVFGMLAFLADTRRVV